MLSDKLFKFRLETGQAGFFDFIKQGLVEINKLFVNDWGSTDAPLVSISLKQEKAQGGKAKSFLQKIQT